MTRPHDCRSPPSAVEIREVLDLMLTRCAEAIAKELDAGHASRGINDSTVALTETQQEN
jgi:hypothetical protein